MGRNAKSGTTSTDQLASYNVKEALAHFDTDDTKVVHWFRCLQQSEKLARDYAEGAGSKPTYLVVKTDTVEVPFQIGVSNTFKKKQASASMQLTFPYMTNDTVVKKGSVVCCA